MDKKNETREGLRLNRRSFIGLGSGLLVSAAVPFANASGKEDKAAAPKKSEKKKSQRPLSAEWREPLTEFIKESQQKDIPEEIRELGKRHILDTIAAVIACRNLDASVVSQRFVLSVNNKCNKDAPILGSKKRTALLDAILASGMRSHAAEINDYYDRALVQPGGPVLSSTLCLGDMRGVSGEALLRAVLVGYEVTCRMPLAIGMRNLQYIGLASHAVGPLWGSAAAVASLLKFDAAKIAHTFSYCTQQTAGHWQWMRDQDHVEKAFCYSGMPAQRGTQCALFAEAGFTGIGDTFTGAPGFLSRAAFLWEKSDFKPDVMAKGLGEEYIMPNVSYKKFATGGPTQPSVDAMLNLIKRVDRKKVKAVQIEMPYSGDDHTLDTYIYASMPALNLPYLMSIILLDGKLDFAMAESRERMNDDPKVAEMKKIVSVIHDPAQEKKPRARSARVTLTLDDGSKVDEFVGAVKGKAPENPLDQTDVEEKAMGLITPYIGIKRAKALVKEVRSLEKTKNVKSIVKLMAC